MEQKRSNGWHWARVAYRTNMGEGKPAWECVQVSETGVSFMHSFAAGDARVLEWGERVERAPDKEPYHCWALVSRDGVAGVGLGLGRAANARWEVMLMTMDEAGPKSFYPISDLGITCVWRHGPRVEVPPDLDRYR